VREDEKKGVGGGIEPCEDGRGDDADEWAAEKGRLIQAETREHGLSSLRTWLLWFKRAGGLPFFTTQLLFMAVDRLAYVAIDFFLAIWTSGAEKSVTIAGIEFPPQTDGQGRYLIAYWTLILVSALATFLRSEWGVVGGGRATRYVFNNMLASVLRAPMSYFERIPMGRILNRFTYDTDVNDVNLTQVRRCICMTLVIVPHPTTRTHPAVVTLLLFRLCPCS
jgi:ABC-type multidrug transport system fused ATPase/permease subunit